MRAKGYVETTTKIEEVKESQLRFKKPTTEEMRLAQLLDDKQLDVERENIIMQVMETTSRLRDDVIIALHDCNYDPIRAIDILMENDDLAKEEWQECGIAKRKKNKAQGNDEPGAAENTLDDGFQNHPNENPQKLRRSRGDKDRSNDNGDNSKPRQRSGRGRGGDDRRSRTVGERHPLSGSNNENSGDGWQNNEPEGHQKPHHRRSNEPGADETNEIFSRRGGARGGASARGRSWYGGPRNGGHDSGRPTNGFGRGARAHQGADRSHPAEPENTADSFQVGTWENSKNASGHADDYEIDEWDGSLTQTQVFERSNQEQGSSNPSYGAIGAKPQQHHDEGPVRVTLDSVMNVAGTRNAKDDRSAASSKSPRREPQQQDKPKPPTPQRQQQPQSTSQRSLPKTTQEPPVVILDNRRHVVDSQGPAGLRFGSGLDSFGLAVGGANGGSHHDNVPKPQAPQPSQARQGAYPPSGSPYRNDAQQQQQGQSPTKQPINDISSDNKAISSGAFPSQPNQQQRGPVGPVGGAPQQQRSAPFQGETQQQLYQRPPSANAAQQSAKPAGLDPSIARGQQQQQTYQKVNGSENSAQQFGVQSQRSQQPSTATSSASSMIMGGMQQPAPTPVYTASNTSASTAQTKLTESMTKLNVQDVVKSPGRQQPTQQQGQPQSSQAPAAPQPATSQAPGFDPMMKFAQPNQAPAAYAMPQSGGTMPYYFPQYPAGNQPQQGAGSSQQSQQQQQQPQNSAAGSVSDYFNNADVSNIYQRTLLEQGGGHGGPQQSGQQPSPMMKQANQPSGQDSRIAPDQLLNMAAQASAQGSAALPPHSSAAGLPPGGVAPAFMTPQLFYPLMQMFAANPALMAPFLGQVPPVPPTAVNPAAAADLKSQAQFLQAVGMSPFLHFAQQQQQPGGSSHPGDELPGQLGGGQGPAGHSAGGSLVVGHQGQDASSVVGQHNQQSHQQHQQQSIRPPPGFLMPVRQSSSGMNMGPSNNNDGIGFRSFQQQQQDNSKNQAPPGLFSQGGQGQAFLAGGGQPRQNQQAGGVMKQSHTINHYNWNPNS